MTLEEFYKATEGMPEDVKIIAEWFDQPIYIEKIIYNKELNVIVLC